LLICQWHNIESVGGKPRLLTPVMLCPYLLGLLRYELWRMCIQWEILGNMKHEQIMDSFVL
jgi:hypothetical protein